MSRNILSARCFNLHVMSIIFSWGTVHAELHERASSVLYARNALVCRRNPEFAFPSRTTGNDIECMEYVMAQQSAPALLEDLCMDIMFHGVAGIFCHKGKHRSRSIANCAADALQALGFDVAAVHLLDDDSRGDVNPVEFLDSLLPQCVSKPDLTSWPRPSRQPRFLSFGRSVINMFLQTNFCIFIF